MRLPTSHVAVFIAASCLIATSVPLTGVASDSASSHTPILSSQQLAKLAHEHRSAAPRLALRPGEVSLLRMRRTVGLVPHRTPQQTASVLRVPDSNFAPAMINTQFDYVDDNNHADQNPFGFKGRYAFHTKSYADLGRIIGYFQRADWNPTGGSVVFRYEGSFMSSAGTAQTAQQDGVAHQLSAGATISPCQTSDTPPKNVASCNVVFFQGTTDQGASVDVQYVAWAVRSCLIETAVEYPASLANDNAITTQIGNAQSNIDNAAAQLASQACSGGSSPTPTSTVPPPPGAATPTRTAVPASSPTPSPTATTTPPHFTATPTQTSLSTKATPTPTHIPTTTSTPISPKGTAIHLVAVHLDKRALKNDLSRPSLARVTVHQSTVLSIFVDILAGALPKNELDFTFSVKRGNTEVLSKKLPEQIPDTRPTHFRETATAQFSKKGKYTFTGTATYLGQSEQQSTTFTVIAAAKKVCTTIGGQQYCTKP